MRVARAWLDDAGINMPRRVLARIVDAAPRLDRDSVGAHLAQHVAHQNAARRMPSRLPYHDPTAEKAIRRACEGAS